MSKAARLAKRAGSEAASLVPVSTILISNHKAEQEKNTKLVI